MGSLCTVPIPRPKALRLPTTNQDITESSRKSILTPLAFMSQSTKTVKRDILGLRTRKYLYHHRCYRRYHIRSGVHAFSTPETSILTHGIGHQVEVPRLDLGITSRLADAPSELPVITRASREDRWRLTR